MNILFICSASGKKSFSGLKNSRIFSSHSDSKIIPFVESQYNSLLDLGISVDLFTIESSGIIGYFRSYRKLRTKVKSKRYDALHAHYTFPGFLALISKSKSSKLVISFLGGDLWGTYDSSGNQTIIGYATKILSKVLAIFCDHIIVKSSFLKSFIPHSKKKETSVIPNGVNFNLFRPLEMSKCKKILGLDDQKSYVLFMSDTEDSRKGFKLVERTFNLLDRKEYEILAPYPQKHKNLKYYYGAASVLVSASKFEGSQNVIKEALACNLPVVSTDSGDAKERLQNLQNSYVTDGTPEDFSSKIILASQKKYNYRHKIENLKLENIAKRVAKIYSNL